MPGCTRVRPPVAPPGRSPSLPRGRRQRNAPRAVRQRTLRARAFAQAGGEEYLAFHLITETLLQRGGDDWRAWYPVVRDKIVGVQNDDGSWSGAHCITSRTFCTSAALLVLQAPHRFLPLSQI